MRMSCRVHRIDLAFALPIVYYIYYVLITIRIYLEGKTKMKKTLMAVTALFIMLGLAACGSQEGKSASVSPAASADANAQQLNIVASNFKFDQAEYKVKAGQPVAVTLKSAEGVHGLEIKGQNVRLDNKKSTATFTPDKKGKYDIVCTIPCGSGHINMRSVLIVE